MTLPEGARGIQPILANGAIGSHFTSVQRLLPSLRWLALLVLLWPVFAWAEPAEFAAVERADRARIAATIAGDVTALGQLLSDDLHYAHSDGRVQTKAEFLAAVGANRIRYLSFDPHDVKLQSIAPGAVTMNGRARIVVEAGGQRLEFTLRFLAVWRAESGQWRLLAYQSSQLKEAADAAGR